MPFVFCAALAEKDNSGSAQILSPTPRQKTKLAALELTDGDQKAILAAMADLQQKMATAMQLTSKGASQEQLARFSEKATAVTVQATLDNLRTTMTPVGFFRFQAHLQTEKRYMKIIPLPSMPTK